MTLARMVVLMLVSRPCFAGSDTGATESGTMAGRQGLIFTYGIGFERSSPSSFAEGGYVVNVMAGYCVTRWWYVKVGVLTGSDRINWEGYSGSLRRLAVGGARFQTEFFTTSGGLLRPFGLLSWDMMTLLTHDAGEVTAGFNGGGPRVAIGVSWEASSSVAAAVQVAYSDLRFWNTVSSAPPGNVPFNDQMVSLEITGSFYPHIFP